MPAKIASKPSLASSHDDLDNYNVDDFDDDPFASPPPEDKNAKKRKEPDSGLGIDEEVNVQKRARVSNVKLDEERLLGPAGIPKLRKRAAGLKIKGKGHEFSDAARLLSFYQLWLDDLFPKAKFLDALAMVEKAGHKKRVMAARNEFINESKPRGRDEEEERELRSWEVGLEDGAPGASNSAAAPEDITTRTLATQPPNNNDEVPDDDDLYDATPRATPRRTTSIPIRTQAPNDEEDFEALIAAAEGYDQTENTATKLASKPTTQDDPDDDLDALMAEAEAHDQGMQKQKESAKTSGIQSQGDDFEDDEAAMQEMDGFL